MSSKILKKSSIPKYPKMSKIMHPNILMRNNPFSKMINYKSNLSMSTAMEN
jgi:hypothetical protein